MINEHLVDWIGIRVISPDGPGTIMRIEQYRLSGKYFFRYGIKHDVFPEYRPRMYKDDILFYCYKDLITEE